jgi:hypothetical protein
MQRNSGAIPGKSGLRLRRAYVHCIWKFRIQQIYSIYIQYIMKYNVCVHLRFCAALMDDANKWQAAIDEELGSCPTLGVWEEVHMPKGKQALPSFFIFEIKREWRYQARLVTDSGRA